MDANLRQFTSKKATKKANQKTNTGTRNQFSQSRGLIYLTNQRSHRLFLCYCYVTVTADFVDCAKHVLVKTSGSRIDLELHEVNFMWQERAGGILKCWYLTDIYQIDIHIPCIAWSFHEFTKVCVQFPTERSFYRFFFSVNKKWVHNYWGWSLSMLWLSHVSYLDASSLLWC